MRARLPWLLVLAGAYALAGDSVKPRPRPAPAPYAGAATCGDCHGAETRAWERSPHARHGIAVKQPEGGADAAVGALRPAALYACLSPIWCVIRPHRSTANRR